MNAARLWLPMIAITVAGASRTIAAEPAKLAGHWEGTISAAGQDLGIVVHIRENDAGWKATIDVPDHGTIGLPVDAVGLDAGVLSLTLKGLGASYRGTLNAGRTEADGRWNQSGLSTPLTLKKSKNPTTLIVPPALMGSWEGKLADRGFGIRIGMRFRSRADGTTLAGFAIPDKGQMFLPISAIALDAGKLKAVAKRVGVTFTGTINDAHTEIVGTWTENAVTVPLTLKKTDKISEPRRPQTPKPPFPYGSVDVTYRNETAGIMLAGTLTVPSGKGPFPAVLMITGSGSQDRDETLFDHKPFLVIADALTRRGIAVLRVDDRGIGKSTGSPVGTTSEDFAVDVRAGVSYLKSRKEIDPKAIGLIGHSEGGLIAPMVAAKSVDVAFIILMAGTGIKGADILKSQSRHAIDTTGLSEKFLKAQDETLDQTYAAVIAEKDAKAALAKLRTTLKLGTPTNEAERKAVQIFTGKSLEAIVAQLSQPWFRFFLAYDPQTSLVKVRCPVLAINGARDVQVPPRPNLAGIAGALKAGGNTNVTIKELAGLNHLFQRCKTGAPSEYAEIEETLDPAVLTLIGDWISATAGPK